MFKPGEFHPGVVSEQPTLRSEHVPSVANGKSLDRMEGKRLPINSNCSGDVGQHLSPDVYIFFDPSLGFSLKS